MSLGRVLLTGLALSVIAALAPAGLGAEPVPSWSWLAWLGAFAVGALRFRRGGSEPDRASGREEGRHRRQGQGQAGSAPGG